MATTNAPKQVLKVRLGGDVRRLAIHLPAGASEEDIMALTRSTVVRGFNLSPAEAESLVLQYIDDEGDSCTFTAVSMEDFLALAAGGVWKLTALLSSATTTAGVQAGADVKLAEQPVEAPVPDAVGEVPDATMEAPTAEPEAEVGQQKLFVPPPRHLQSMAEAIGMTPADEEPEAEVQVEAASPTVAADAPDSAKAATAEAEAGPFNAAEATTSVAAAVSCGAGPGWKRVMQNVMSKHIWGRDHDNLDEKVVYLMDMGLVDDKELARDLLRAQKGDLEKVMNFLSG